jgi:hypothetical protein
MKSRIRNTSSVGSELSGLESIGSRSLSWSEIRIVAVAVEAPPKAGRPVYPRELQIRKVLLSSPSLVEVSSRTALPRRKLRVKCRVTVDEPTEPFIQFLFVPGIVELAVDDCNSSSTRAREAGVFVRL